MILTLSVSQSAEPPTSDGFNEGAEEVTAEEEQKTIDWSLYQNPEEGAEGEFLLTDDANGIAQVTPDQTICDAVGDCTIGFGTQNMEVQNGLVTGGLFTANAEASLLKVHNTLFDVYFDMSEGDTVEVADTSPRGTELDYFLNKLTEGIKALIQYDTGATQEFQASSNNSLYFIYKNETHFAITEGILTYTDENLTQVLEAGEENTQVEATKTGIKKGILYKNKTFSQKADLLNITIKNTENEEYVICTEASPDCQATLIDNVLVTNGKVTVLQDGLPLYETLDASAVVEMDFNTKILQANILKPNREEYLLLYVGHYQVIEGKGKMLLNPVKEEHASIVNTYISILNDRTILFNEGTVSYNTFKAFTPGSAGEDSCIAYRGEGNGYC